MSPLSSSGPFGDKEGSCDPKTSSQLSGGEDRARYVDHRLADAKVEDEYVTVTIEADMHSGNGGAAGPERHPSHARNTPAAPGTSDAPYSPLRTMYSPLMNMPDEPPFAVERKVHKVMVGHNGWLERTDKPVKKAPVLSKKAGLLDALKRMAKEVAEVTDVKSAWRGKEHERGRPSSRVRISLDPREQSLLYCELEFLLTSALDSYINSQFNAGRLDADKFKKVADAWHQKGRPKVVGFRYDLETQLDLVFLHVSEFRFYGDRAGIPAAISGILDMMRVNARALRIRTFCQPDSVIAKQLLDSQSLLNLLGSAEQRQIQLAEVVQFFKVILAREHTLGRNEERGLQSSRTAKTLPRTPDDREQSRSTQRGR